MSRSLSWLDPEALAASLARAGVVRGGPGAAAPPRPPAAEATRAGAPRAAIPPPLPPAAAIPEPAPPAQGFEPPAGSLAERLDAFSGWLEAATGARGVFLADRDGLPVVARQVGDELIAASAMVTRFLELAHSRHRALEDGSLALQLEGGGLIYFLQDRGEAGNVCLGFVVAEPVGRNALDHVRRALRRTFSGGVGHLSATPTEET